jgi:hypothetical protein
MSNQFGINVESSGGITIENETVIKPINDTGRFTFVVRSGARIVMRDSEILGCGWGIPYQAFNDENTGLFIYADNAVLERNLFSNNFNGVVLKNADKAHITANRFTIPGAESVSGIPKIRISGTIPSRTAITESWRLKILIMLLQAIYSLVFLKGV